MSPTVEPDVVTVAHDAGAAAIIGGLTPTEILAAWRAGADVVKVFPGRIATPGYFADLAGPLPHIPLMPTGNVDLETAPAYLKAGAIAVGVGKALDQSPASCRRTARGRPVRRCPVARGRRRIDRHEPMTDRPVAVVYGELLMRLDPPGFQRLVQADTFEVRFTGAEANAGVSLVNFGVPTRVVSRVPDSEIGEACVRFMRRHGLDTTFVARGGERLGLFYLETGVAQRPSKVIYDRSGTSFRTPEQTDYDWPAIFAGAAWFHFSGTAAALGPRAVEVLDEALTAAAGAGVTVSCDLNYRKMLWGDRAPASVMEPLMDRVHVLIGNEEDTERVFGIRAGASDPRAGRAGRGFLHASRAKSWFGGSASGPSPRPCAAAGPLLATVGQRSCPTAPTPGRAVPTTSTRSSIASARVMRSRAPSSTAS